ncbi:MAG: UDP-N-acetylglucosamine--N-acetylmuramyl-(pentapeptide) pyrophosphoryl-undecaprenol N-acetylglucosamine transferase [Clostridia bacterium]|nr:UDP-N-acetylglucosamine--N-acetylmuramyl-(pentapeptide) pyrophosphoryl-undecaprenol N-acetylglucosamine transferase [Clostridia bacterium]
MQKIVLCGGGTLGHFTPNIAIFEKLNSDYDFIYIGTKDGMEKEKAKLLMPYKEVETCKLIRSFTLKNLAIPFKLFKGIREAKKILKQEKPALIFSKGGFASIPVVIAGKALKIPCITHESDLSLGLANKLIAKKCKFVCTSFEETAKNLKNGIYTGTPIREQIFKGKASTVIDKFNLDKNKKTIVVIGGSLGSENINKVVRESLPYLKNEQILHITGKGKQDKKVTAPNYHQIEYAENIEDYFALADLVITRGGSNTLFELLALKKTMLIIPLGTNVSRGDQIQNANEFKKRSFANVLFEENLNAQTLVKEIKETINSTKTFIANIEQKSKNGTEIVCNLIKETIKTTAKNT